MTRRAVTQAQIQRVTKAFEAAGKTVVGAVFLADGSWEVRLTDHPGAALPSEPAEDGWAAGMAKWRRSA